MPNNTEAATRDTPDIEKRVARLPVATYPLHSTTNQPISVEWDGPNDGSNPMTWSKTRKWLISSIGYAFLALVCMSTTAYTTAQPSLEDALNVSQFIGTLGVVAFNISYGAAPLLLAPLSELFGRLPVYILSAILFWIMFLPQALAKNFATVIAARFLSGIGASTAVSIVIGTLTDIWDTRDRGLPMAIFSFVSCVGAGLGPVSFGYVELYLGYKYVNWIIFGICGVFTIFLIVFARETRGSVILIRKAARYRAEMGDVRYRVKAEEEQASLPAMIKESLTRPIRLLFTEPVVFAFTAWLTYAEGILYLMLQSLPLVFNELYGFNSGEDGLIFLGQIVGPVFGFAINIFCERLYTRDVSTKGPEARLYIAMISGLMMPLGFWMYTWTAWRSVHWIAPAIGVALIYASTFGIYLACYNYLADSYTVYASSALSALSCVRLIVGALFGLFAEPMYHKLGTHNAGTLLATLSSIFAITPLILYRYGAVTRARSSVAKHLASLESLV